MNKTESQGNSGPHQCANKQQCGQAFSRCDRYGVVVTLDRQSPLCRLLGNFRRIGSGLRHSRPTDNQLVDGSFLYDLHLLASALEWLSVLEPCDLCVSLVNLTLQDDVIAQNDGCVIERGDKFGGFGWKEWLEVTRWNAKRLSLRYIVQIGAEQG